MVDRTEFANRIKVARGAKGWSCQQLADRLGISETRMNGIERGRYERLPEGDIYNVAHILGLDFMELMALAKQAPQFITDEFCRRPNLMEQLISCAALLGDDDLKSAIDLICKEKLDEYIKENRASASPEGSRRKTKRRNKRRASNRSVEMREGWDA
jgi:ribosome-binding protein aMBF1 (putative translation factor)